MKVIKKGFTTAKQSQDMEQQIKNISSNLRAGNNINIKSGSDTNIIASNLTAVNRGNIAVGSYLDTATSTETINKDAVLNILSAKDSDYKYRYASSTKMDVGAIAVGMTAGSLTGLFVTVAGAYIGSQAKKGQINTSEKYDETIISSNLNIGVNKEVHYSNSTQEKFGVNYTAIAAGAVIAGAVATTPMFGQYALISGVGVAGIAGNMAQRTSTSSSSSRQENLVSSNIDAVVSSLLKSQNNINIIASNYSTVEDATIIAGKYLDEDSSPATYRQEIYNKDASVNILNAKDVTTTLNESKRSGIEFSDDYAKMAVGYAVAGPVGLAMTALEANKYKDVVGSRTEEIVQSNLTFGKSINIASASDLNVRSSNLNAGVNSITGLESGKKNAVKYIAINSAANYLGAGVASPYLATYDPALASMGEGDSFDESLAKNGDYINEANTINNAGKSGVGSAGLTLELAYSQQKLGFKQSDVVSSSIFSNSDINLTSAVSDLSIHSSNLSAENNINLNATKGDINILADTNNSDSFSRSFAITASIPLIGKDGSGSLVFSKSKSKSEDYINSSLVANNQFNLNSGNDTNIISSNILASDIKMLVAKDLNLESRQNTSTSKATSFSIGRGFNSSGEGKSGSGNISYSKSASDRDWVDNQASILGTNSQ